MAKVLLLLLLLLSVPRLPATPAMVRKRAFTAPHLPVCFPGCCRNNCCCCGHQPPPPWSLNARSLRRVWLRALLAALLGLRKKRFSCADSRSGGVSSGVKPNTAWRKGLPCKWTCTVQKHRTHTQGRFEAGLSSTHNHRQLGRAENC